MKKHFLFLAAFLTAVLCNSQPSIQWQKCLGGTTGDLAHSIQQTFDGGYIVSGIAASNNGDVSGNHGNDDFWVVKLDNAGIIQWQKCLGGTNYEQSYSIQQTADSGYVIAGFAASNSGDVIGNHGGDDFWVVKLSNSGSIQWQKSLGGTLLDNGFSIQQTSDGGYIIAGDTQSNNGDVSGNHGSFDSWVVKLNSIGSIQWQKCLGGTSDDTSASIRQTYDGGYIIAGSTLSNNGDVSGNHGNWDYWIVKLDIAGSLQWQKCLGGSGEDIGYSIQQSVDSGYIVSGFTRSNNGDVTGIHGAGLQPDYWVVKLNNSGSLQWQKCLGGTGDDKSYSIRQTSDSGYVVTGFTKSNDGDVSGNHGSVGTQDFWLVKLNSAGTMQWQKCLGGTGNDWARSAQQTGDGGYVVAGWTLSNDGDVSGNHGNNDFWVVKLSPFTTGIKKHDQAVLKIFPNPSSGIFTLAAEGLNGQADLKIVNALGQIVYKAHLSKESIQIDLSEYSTGIYFAVIEAEGQKTVRKIILE